MHQYPVQRFVMEQFDGGDSKSAFLRNSRKEQRQDVTPVETRRRKRSISGSRHEWLEEEGSQNAIVTWSKE
uniref:Uncharacterized protein n=1 Tax=Cucumis melo TaxID=3656 RepID=A0A9I9ED57_CUCME